ncbi:MAG: hypothetical protein RQ826_08250 [Xanthomonadales bacterium]|nr:hypothetical protein [Xanthomonadales bacterium]
MSTVQLGFKAFDCHELLCHAVAQEAGLYAEQGLSVRLLDTTFTPDEALPADIFHAACGAALADFLQGRERRVVFVACERPMFWLFARPGIDTLSALNGARVASFPEVAPPAAFLRKLLSDESVAPDLLPARDDVARLGLLRSGSVEAALFSAQYLPHQLEAIGLQELLFIGDRLRLPSTGLAVSGELFEREPERVAAMVAIFRQAMQLIFADDQLLARVLTESFAMPAQSLQQALTTVRNCLNRSGFSDAALLQAALDRAARGMGLKSRPAGELYRFDFVQGGD